MKAYLRSLYQVTNMQKQPLIEVIGRHRVLIENHAGITEYGDSQIIVRVYKGCINLNGSNMKLSQMTQEKLVITGKIQEIRLSEGGER